jgi:hypothetical protein
MLWSRSTKLAPSPVDLEDRVVADLRCIKCGASLRGQSVNALCPHCGHPCSDSVYGDYLIYSDRAEVDRLDEAAHVVIYGGMLLGVIIAIAMLCMVVYSENVVEAIRRGFDTLWAGVLVSPVIATTGMVLLTRRYSIAYYEAKYFNQRFMIRAGIWAGLVVILACVAAYFRARDFQVVLLAAWATVPSAAFMRGLARLMRRVPNVKLAGFAQVLGGGIWVTGVLSLLFNWLRPLAVEQADWEAPLLALQVLVSCGWLVLGLAGLRLLMVIHRNFLAIRR